LLTGVAQGGLADLNDVNRWNMAFVDNNPLKRTLSGLSPAHPNH